MSPDTCFRPLQILARIASIAGALALLVFSVITAQRGSRTGASPSAAGGDAASAASSKVRTLELPDVWVDPARLSPPPTFLPGSKSGLLDAAPLRRP